MAYVHGNLAFKEKKQEQSSVRYTKKTVIRRKSLPVQEKLLYLFTIALCVVVAGAIIFRYAQIYEMNTQIQKIEKDIEMLQVENSNLKLKLAQKSDPAQIRKQAEALGYRMMEEGQEVKPISPSGLGTNHNDVAMNR